MLNSKRRLRPSLPVVGDALAFRQDLLAALTRGRTSQGEVARYRLGPVPVFGVSSPEVAACTKVSPRSRAIGSKGRAPFRKAKAASSL